MPELDEVGGLYLGAVEEGRLAAVYNLADVFVMPTRVLEMFGMAAVEGQEDELRRWVCADALPWLCTQPGIIAAHLLEATATAPMTKEQRIRGKDADIRFALFATGYDHAAMTRLLHPALQFLEGPAAISATARAGVYRLAAALLDADPMAAGGSGTGAVLAGRPRQDPHGDGDHRVDAGEGTGRHAGAEQRHQCQDGVVTERVAQARQHPRRSGQSM